jgi:ketosteroid isomerase-like protein
VNSVADPFEHIVRAGAAANASRFRPGSHRRAELKGISTILLNMQRSLLVCLLAFCLCVPRPLRGDDTATVEGAIVRFLKAFNNLDWSAFWGFFDEKATAFFPDTPTTTSSRRLEGTELEAGWHRLFSYLQGNSGRSEPPYLKIDVQDMRIDRLADDVALVTFHVGPSGRRTFVWKRSRNGWRIVHLHGSALSSQAR